MLKELLRPMATSGALAGDNSDAESGSGTLNQFACESLAGALSAGGGIGIANRILQSFPGSGSNPKSVLGTDDLPFRPATNLHK
jgi:Rod binding domain-containing protein